MKKLAILIALAALSACSDSSNGQAPVETAPSVTDKGVTAEPTANTTTPKTDALPSAEVSLKARWDELRPAYIAARDEYREIRARLNEKDEELKAAIAAKSADESRIGQEAEQLRLALKAAQDKFSPINKEMQALKEQIELLRAKN